ncbi:MAG: choice-of-anchor D domain-containing protein [Ignavibacteria bacterium]|nr:choice-of-anchor D domain-containing protein [Ignavibacteria bacterium]
MAFNNRQGQGTSIIAEIIPPGNGSGQYPLTPGTAWAPTAPTWTYTAGGFYSSHLGGVQRLPNGNTLIAQSTSGKMLEVTSGGAVVWSFTPGGEIVRAYRYATDYSGILLSGLKVSKVEVSAPTLTSWPTVSVPFRVTCLDTVRYGLDKSWFTILEDTARITNFTISCPGSGTGMCTLSYTSSCPDGAQRALSIRFSGYCSLDTTVVKNITVPRDTAALAPVHVALADVAVKDLTLATVPLNLLDPLSNQTLAPSTFEVRYDRALCEFVGISTPPGSLLAGVSISETPTPEGMKFSIPSPRVVTGSGKLADLVFRRVATGASVRAGLHLTGWAFASGCLKALQGDGSATYESTQRMSASLPDSSSIDFGEVILGQSATRSFILRSTGEGALTVHALAVAGANAADFTAVSPAAPRVLAAGKSDTVVLKYSPAIPGAGTGTLTVQCDDPTRPSFTVFLTGSCIAQARRPVLSCSVADSGTLDFGTVTQHGTVTRTLVMTNTGSSPLQVSGETVTGANAADFALTKGNGPHTIAPGLSDTLVLTFSWRATGARSATLTLASNDSTKQPYTVFLTGIGALVDYSLTSTVTILDFGSVVIGKDSVRAVRLANGGRLAVPVLSQVLAGADSSQFSLTRRSASTIPATGADSILVQFRPQAAGQKTAELRVTWSDQQAGQTIPVVLRGAGVAVMRPILRTHVDTLRFDTTVVGTPVHGTLVATNAGNAALVVQSQGLSGADAARFSSQTSLPRTLQPGDTARLAYTFTPAAEGPATAMLVLTSNDAVAPNTTVLLLAHAMAAPSPRIAASLSAVDFGDVTVGSTKDTSVLISNTGTADLLLSGQAVTGADATQFAVPVPASATVSAAQSSRVTLRFSPTDAGPKSAIFRVLSNDGLQPQLDIALRGIGSAPSATDNPARASLIDLGQNYPNPFGAGSPTGGDRTTIPYHLRAAGHVTLSVRDMLGREVALLTDRFEEAGRHTAELHARALPAGIYVYQLTTGARVASRTLLLLR